MTVNSDGRVVSVTVTQPRFTPAEKALLLASWRESRTVRGRHGLPLAETTDPALQNEWVVPLPIRDFAQQRLDSEQSAYEEAYPNADKDSLLWRVEKKS